MLRTVKSWTKVKVELLKLLLGITLDVQYWQGTLATSPFQPYFFFFLKDYLSFKSLLILLQCMFSLNELQATLLIFQI